MLILIAILLTAIPAVAIAYPFLRRSAPAEWLDDESAPMAALQRRWDAALDGIKSAELEFAIGNLDEADYQWLRRQYMREAALVMRAMDLEDEQEQALLQTIETEAQQVRQRILGSEPTTD